jgi:hypothetical protein
MLAQTGKPRSYVTISIAELDKMIGRAAFDCKKSMDRVRSVPSLFLSLFS